MGRNKAWLGILGAGLFVMPFMATPVTAISSDTPSTTPKASSPSVPPQPSKGKTRIQFGDGSTYEFDMPVETVFLPDRRMAVKLPEGTPPPPADRFEPAKDADGRTVYVIKTISPKPNAVPAVLRQIIIADTESAELHLGDLIENATVARLSYRYTHPIRLEEDLTMKQGWGKPVIVLPSGSNGFVSGRFKLHNDPYDVINAGVMLFCFFDLRNS